MMMTHCWRRSHHVVHTRASFPSHCPPPRAMSFSLGAKKGAKLAFGIKGQSKAVKPAVFDAASDEEEEAVHDQKRPRRSFTETAPANASKGETKLIAEDPEPGAEEKRTADKLADFVAKNGRNFEEITRQRNPNGGIFKFLFEKQSAGYKYYERRLGELSTAATRPPSFLATTPMPVAPQPVSAPKASSVQQAQQVAQQIAAKLAAKGPTPVLGGVSSGTVRSASAASTDSIAAMEAAMKSAAEREEARKKAELEEEEAARQPLLNDTSFDRRRVMAVYKEDGSRGHHMQDYIPKEELAKFLAASGSEEAKVQAEAIEAASRIQSSNIGHKLLSQMGWKEGQGLGAQGAGMAAPVAAEGAFGTEKRGLGAQDHTAVQEGDDEFETYRKRMMLGYKHRPNPLGNPRKSYY